MNGFVTIPPKQKYMTLSEICETYGSCSVVAYSCKVIDSVPNGGFVIAVQDKPGTDNSKLKEYQRQFMQKYPAKAPVYYLRMETTRGGQYLTLIYDNGTGEKKTTLRIEVKRTESETVIERIPDELLAKALVTALKTPDQE